LLSSPPTFQERKTAPWIGWIVAANGESFTATEYRDEEQPDVVLPFDASKASLPSSPQHLLRVADGWLVGCDDGEFGGALAWFRHDGSRSKHLLRENVIGLVPSAIGVLVLTGLAHMGHIEGGVYVYLEQGHRVRKIAALGAPPHSVAVAGDGQLFALTLYGLFKVSPSGRLVMLMNGAHQFLFLSDLHDQPLRKQHPVVDFRPLWPISLAATVGGVVYAGFNWFIARLTPEGSRYQVDWLAPRVLR